MKIVVYASSYKEARERIEITHPRFYYVTSKKIKDGMYEMTMEHRKEKVVTRWK